MMECKFTDDEIVKALECCLADRVICDKCPIQRECESNPFDATLVRYSLDLINRQKEERKTVRAEAIKEFAERLKAKSEYGTINVSPWQIDNLVKEMTNTLEENNNER